MPAVIYQDPDEDEKLDTTYPHLNHDLQQYREHRQSVDRRKQSQNPSPYTADAPNLLPPAASAD